jgi:tRNA-binding protein
MEASQQPELLVGRIIAAEDLVGGRGPSYRLTIDLGPRGVSESSVQIGANYLDRDLLIGTQVVCVLGDQEPVVLFAQSHAKGVVLIRPEEGVEEGTIVA